MKKKTKRNVLVGVSAGIAAYKTCVLVRLLVKNGYSVKVIMTEAATKFITPLTFGSLSQKPVHINMFEQIKEEPVKHISLTQWADICVVAPCSANTLSKVALGICDNLLTTVICAFAKKTPVLIAPAMNDCMWQNPIIQDKVSLLKKLKKYTIIVPEKGALACGTYGLGRMPEAEDIYKKLTALI